MNQVQEEHASKNLFFYYTAQFQMHIGELLLFHKSRFHSIVVLIRQSKKNILTFLTKI